MSMFCVDLSSVLRYFMDGQYCVSMMRTYYQSALSKLTNIKSAIFSSSSYDEYRDYCVMYPFITSLDNVNIVKIYSSVGDNVELLRDSLLVNPEFHGMYQSVFKLPDNIREMQDLSDFVNCSKSVADFLYFTDDFEKKTNYDRLYNLMYCPILSPNIVNYPSSYLVYLYTLFSKFLVRQIFDNSQFITYMSYYNLYGESSLKITRDIVKSLIGGFIDSKISDIANTVAKVICYYGYNVLNDTKVYNVIYPKVYSILNSTLKQSMLNHLDGNAYRDSAILKSIYIAFSNMAYRSIIIWLINNIISNNQIYGDARIQEYEEAEKNVYNNDFMSTMLVTDAFYNALSVACVFKHVPVKFLNVLMRLCIDSARSNIQTININFKQIFEDITRNINASLLTQLCNNYISRANINSLLVSNSTVDIITLYVFDYLYSLYFSSSSDLTDIIKQVLYESYIALVDKLYVGRNFDWYAIHSVCRECLRIYFIYYNLLGDNQNIFYNLKTRISTHLNRLIMNTTHQYPPYPQQDVYKFGVHPLDADRVVDALLSMSLYHNQMTIFCENIIRNTIMKEFSLYVLLHYIA